MTEEQKCLSGKAYCPGDPSLRAIKLKSQMKICYRLIKSQWE